METLHQGTFLGWALSSVHYCLNSLAWVLINEPALAHELNEIN